MPGSGTLMSDKDHAEATLDTTQVIPACVGAWLLPGFGHVLLRRRWRGLIFLVVVTVMFVLGLYLHGELFPLDRTKPLTLLAGLAEVGVGLPYFVAKVLGLGGGEIESVTYEYGYTFCIVAGLLNMLILLDAYDIAVGRKR